MLQRIRARAEASEDLMYGQSVIVTARWVLVLAGLLLALWNPASLAELRIELFVILTMAVVNFYLHAHLLMRKSTLDLVVWIASAADLLVVTLLIAVQGGYASHLYIFYFPAVLGLSVAFSTRLTLVYAGTAAALYAVVGLGTAASQLEAQTIVTRVIALLAIAACGNLYWRIENDRRARWDGPSIVQEAGPRLADPLLNDANKRAGLRGA